MCVCVCVCVCVCAKQNIALVYLFRVFRVHEPQPERYLTDY